MRILTVLDSYPPDLNGGAYFTHRLALSLQQKGHAVLVICPSKSLTQGYSEYEGIRIYGVRSWPIFNYKKFRVCWPIFIKRGILNAIKEFKPDLVHLQGKFFLGGISYRACLKMGIPLIATNHFMPENFFHYTKLPRRCENWFKKICWRIVIDMLSHVDRVTTPTKTAAKLLKEANLQKEIHVISCGVDLKKFRPNHDASLIRQQFQIPVKPTLLYTGRLDKEKNLDTVLKAFHLALQQIDAHFVIVGSGAEKVRLETLTQLLNIQGHVTFTGYLSDVEYPTVFGLGNCFVNASTAELQSIVSLEAIASGLPLLGANAMALPELINQGKNGYLFSPNDVEALSRYMIDILCNPEQAKRMGAASRTLAKSHDLALTTQHYVGLYQEIIGL